jgi:hypothetical protein
MVYDVIVICPSGSQRLHAMLFGVWTSIGPGKQKIHQDYIGLISVALV